jgi:hypothetical protein
VVSDGDQEQRVTLWRTAWGVVVAASVAFTMGYGASHFADPSVGAERTPAWPLFVSSAVVVVSLWFLVAPNLRRWPFELKRDAREPHDEPWTGRLSDEDEPAPIGSFRVEPPQPRDDPDA